MSCPYRAQFIWCAHQGPVRRAQGKLCDLNGLVDRRGSYFFFCGDKSPRLKARINSRTPKHVSDSSRNSSFETPMFASTDDMPWLEIPRHEDFSDPMSFYSFSRRHGRNKKYFRHMARHYQREHEVDLYVERDVQVCRLELFIVRHLSNEW